MSDERFQQIRLLEAMIFASTDPVPQTGLAARLPDGTDVVGLLRSFHALVEEAVFGNQGTLDKYIGDGVMATFGTPWPGAHDATHAVALMSWTAMRGVLRPLLRPLSRLGIGYSAASLERSPSTL